MMRALRAIVHREFLRFWHQKGRFFSALVRPLVWLFIFGAGFRAALGLSIIPPYETYIRYETYIVPGLCGMILLFNGMQSALAMVYDREVGSMRLLLTAPHSRAWILFCRLIASVLVGIAQCYVFLAIATLFGIRFAVLGWVAVCVPFALGGMLFGAFGLLISSRIKQLQNFAGIMNFVIFPLFFLSTALYPLWRLQEGSPLLAMLARLNPFTYAVEAIRFALYLQIDVGAILVVFVLATISFGSAVIGYAPKVAQWRRVQGG